MTMKKYLYIIASVTLALLASSCEKEQGTVPGSDGKAVLTTYQYTPSSEYNADNDVQVRFAANNKVVDVYYLVEDTATVNSYVAAQGEDAYAKKVVSDGTKLADAGGKIQDVVITGLEGSFFITAVGTDASGNLTEAKTLYFKGLKWVTKATGSYSTTTANIVYLAGGAVLSTSAVLQKCENDEGRWRIKDGLGAGYDITMWEYKDPIQDRYQSVYVPATPTPISYGSYGQFSMRDVGTWQGSYDDYTYGYSYIDLNTNQVSLWIQWYAGNTNFGYGTDTFTPAS